MALLRLWRATATLAPVGDMEQRFWLLQAATTAPLVPVTLTNKPGHVLGQRSRPCWLGPSLRRFYWGPCWTTFAVYRQKNRQGCGRVGRTVGCGEVMDGSGIFGTL